MANGEKQCECREDWTDGTGICGECGLKREQPQEPSRRRTHKRGCELDYEHDAPCKVEWASSGGEKPRWPIPCGHDFSDLYAIHGAPVRIEPSVLFQQSLKVGLDGDKYFVLFGPNIMEGVSGYGSTMDEAMQDFNRNWVMQKAPNPTGAGA